MQFDFDCAEPKLFLHFGNQTLQLLNLQFAWMP